MIGERIKKLRKALDLTQQEFSNHIGCSRNLVANYEIGNRNPSSSVINNICKTFNVSETWLRTGEGEMFTAKPATVLDALAAEYGLSSGDYIAVEKFLSLKPEARTIIVDYMREVAASISAGESAPAAPAFAPAPTIEDEARTEAEQYARKIYPQILAEKKAQAGLSSESSGPMAGGGTKKQA